MGFSFNLFGWFKFVAPNRLQYKFIMVKSPLLIYGVVSMNKSSQMVCVNSSGVKHVEAM